MSLSARRAWIEIQQHLLSVTKEGSLSARRAWIEIRHFQALVCPGAVALRKESVDRNCFAKGRAGRHSVALRKESVDRNSSAFLKLSLPRMSLSARRAWIEIQGTLH